MSTSIQKRESGATTAPQEPERTRSAKTYRPDVDIVENGDEILLRADVPGAAAGDIDVEFENGNLSLCARVAPRHPETGRHYLLREFGVGDFVRTFQIGDTIDAQRITAEVAAGVLTLHLPKTSAAKLRKIAVKPT